MVTMTTMVLSSPHGLPLTECQCCARPWLCRSKEEGQGRCSHGIYNPTREQTSEQPLSHGVIRAESCGNPSERHLTQTQGALPGKGSRCPMAW